MKKCDISGLEHVIVVSIRSACLRITKIANLLEFKSTTHTTSRISRALSVIAQRTMKESDPNLQQKWITLNSTILS